MRRGSGVGIAVFHAMVVSLGGKESCGQAGCLMRGWGEDFHGGGCGSIVHVVRHTGSVTVKAFGVWSLEFGDIYLHC